MAVWRTKAYEYFNLRPGTYSSAMGKTELFADLVVAIRAALRDGEIQSIDRIVEYVIWATSQYSDQLASAVDLAFFLPVFRDAELCSQLREHVPETVFAEKWQLLMAKTT